MPPCPGPRAAKFWVLAIFCSILPDTDVLGFALGIPYAHPLGHRGFFHSTAQAVSIKSYRLMSRQHTGSPYQLFSILSLDVVTGTLIGAAFVSRLCDVHPGTWFYLALALSVWIIYTADHLVDAWRLKGGAHTFRHRFHYRHFALLVWVVALLSGVVLWLVLTRLDTRILAGGLILAAVCIVYFMALSLLTTRRSLFLQKELTVALIYGAGVWLGPVVLRGEGLAFEEALLFLMYVLVVWSVVLLYSVIEVEQDHLDGHLTLATRFSVVPCRRLVHLLIVLALVLGSCLIVVSDQVIRQQAAMLLMGMALASALLDGFRRSLKAGYRYRYIGEWIFWMPVIVVLFV